MEDNHYIFLDLCDLRDQSILAVRHPHVGSVVSFRLKSIGKSCKDHCHVSFLCSLYCLVQHSLVYNIFFHIISLSVSHLCHLFHSFQSAGDLKGIDVRASASLEPGCFCKFSDKGDLLSLSRQRKNSFVFQKHHRLPCNFGSQFVIFLQVKFSFLTVICKFKDNIQDSFHCPVQHSLFKFPALYCFYDFVVCVSAASRHFQFQSGF